MRTRLHPLGNSQAVIIPKPLLQQLGIGRTVELEIVDDHLELRNARREPREGWVEAFESIPDEALELTEEERVFLDIPNDSDETEPA